MTTTGDACPLPRRDQSLGARQQFTQIKRFGEVVVGPGIEQGDDGILVVTRGQHQHGCVLSP